MTSARSIFILAAMALFALVAACADQAGTETPTSSAGDGTPTATGGATPTSTAPTATRPAGTPTPTAVSIDLSGLEEIDFDSAEDGTFSEMSGLDVGSFDSDTTFMTDLEAPTDVTTPEIDFTLNLP